MGKSADKLKKAQKRAQEDQDSLTNQIRDMFGMKKLPKSNPLDAGFAGSRMKKPSRRK